MLSDGRLRAPLAFGAFPSAEPWENRNSGAFPEHTANVLAIVASRARERLGERGGVDGGDETRAGRRAPSSSLTAPPGALQSEHFRVEVPAASVQKRTRVTRLRPGEPQRVRSSPEPVLQSPWPVAVTCSLHRSSAASPCVADKLAFATLSRRIRRCQL